MIMNSHDNDVLSTNSVVQMCTFRIAGYLFGVDILDVEEVDDSADIIPVYYGPPDVCGFINTHGRMLPVVNLYEKLRLDGKQKEERRAGSKIVVLRRSVNDSFGILVDDVCEAISIDPKRVIDRRSSGKRASEFRKSRRRRDLTLKGVYPLEEELLLVLNAAHSFGSRAGGNNLSIEAA